MCQLVPLSRRKNWQEHTTRTKREFSQTRRNKSKFIKFIKYDYIQLQFKRFFFRFSRGLLSKCNSRLRISSQAAQIGVGGRLNARRFVSGLATRGGLVYNKLQLNRLIKQADWTRLIEQAEDWKINNYTHRLWTALLDGDLGAIRERSIGDRRVMDDLLFRSLFNSQMIKHNLRKGRARNSSAALDSALGGCLLVMQ